MMINKLEIIHRDDLEKDKDDRMIVGGTGDWEQYNIRDGMQFRPTLIINGEKVYFFSYYI